MNDKERERERVGWEEKRKNTGALTAKRQFLADDKRQAAAVVVVGLKAQVESTFSRKGQRPLLTGFI